MAIVIKWEFEIEAIESTAKILSENLISLRKMRGLTQGRLAAISSIPRSTITYLESGSGNPSLQNMVKVAKALEVKVEELFIKRVAQTHLIKSKDIPSRDKNGSHIFNLLPTPVKGLVLEKFELSPCDGFTGIPHLKGTTEYFICIQGKAQVSVAGESFIVNKGDILVFSGNENHSYKNLSSSKTMAISVVAQNIN